MVSLRAEKVRGERGTHGSKPSYLTLHPASASDVPSQTNGLLRSSASLR